MSTRCNLMLIANVHTMWLYRHHDGYLSMTGADVLTKVSQAIKAWDSGYGYEPHIGLANAFLQDLYEQASYEKKPRHVYELTADQHGDIEFLYRMNVCQTGEHLITVDFQARHNWRGPNQWTVWKPLTVAAVNAEIEAANRRAEGYYKERGQPFTPQELLPV